MLVRHNPSPNMHRARQSRALVDLDDVEITVVDDEPPPPPAKPLLTGRMRRMNPTLRETPQAPT